MMMMAPSGSSLGLAALSMPTDPLAAAFPVSIPSYGTLPSLNPPLYFEMVEFQVYRSNKFDSSSFTFVSSLQLNTVVYLSPDELSRELTDFFKEKEVNVIHLGLKYRTLSEGLAKEAIEYILDQRRHPIMVVCKTGVHYAGTIIGCLRRLQNWSLTATIDKYRNIASNVKARFENEQFIELFDVDLVTLPQHLPSWFLLNQKLMEEERLALARGETYPWRRSSSSASLSHSASSSSSLQPATGTGTGAAPLPVAASATTESPEKERSPGPLLAYQKHFFHLQGPLVSESVKFSEKKSIIGDDDDD